MRSNAIKVNEKDNVAVAAEPISEGSAVVVGGQALLDAIEEIPFGHKVALSSFGAGERVVRYGEPIVEATQDIEAGSWVHVHNTRPILRDL